MHNQVARKFHDISRIRVFLQVLLSVPDGVIQYSPTLLMKNLVQVLHDVLARLHHRLRFLPNVHLNVSSLISVFHRPKIIWIALRVLVKQQHEVLELTRFQFGDCEGIRLTAKCEVDGNHAKAKCYLLVYITKNGNSKLLAPGTYECDLVKIKEEWYFNKRIVTMDHDYILEGI